jgi:hypothetical protein
MDFDRGRWLDFGNPPEIIERSAGKVNLDPVLGGSTPRGHLRWHQAGLNDEDFQFNLPLMMEHAESRGSRLETVVWGKGH